VLFVRRLGYKERIESHVGHRNGIPERNKETYFA
jgi:hypothetical protein